MRKTANVHKLQIHLDKSLADKLLKLAKQHERSIKGETTVAIREYLERQDAARR